MTVSGKPVEAGKGVEKSNKGEMVVVTVDTKISEVVRLNKEGAQLAFRDDLGKFLELGDTVLAELDARNRQAYFLAKAVHESRKDEPFNGVVSQEALNFGTPAERKLRVQGRSDMQYLYFRPEEVEDQMMLGWKVTSDGVKTFRGQQNGSVQITRDGKQEMILMELPRKQLELSRKMQDEALEKWSNGVLPQAQKGEFDSAVKGSALSGREEGNMSPIATSE